jgi:hypothetical protein
MAEIQQGGDWRAVVGTSERQLTIGWRFFERSGFDLRLVDQHDGNIVFHRVHAMARCALQALGILAIFKGLLVGGANQHFEKIFGNHAGNYTRRQKSRGQGSGIRG